MKNQRYPHFSVPSEVGQFIQNLPKTETHLHMEGACPFELLKLLDPEKYSEVPPFWHPDYRYESFDKFMDMYVQYCSDFFTSADRYHEAAKIVLAKCKEQNVHYVETSFHLPVLEFIEEGGPEILSAIRSACPDGMELRIFAGICHDSYRGAMIDIIDRCLEWEDLAGIDLHGPENLPMEPWTEQLWKQAKETGKMTKAHAGEFMPASYVSWVLDHLKVDRIEHGVRSIEDPQLVKRLAEEAIPLDVCPISNLKLAVEGIPSMNKHPIRRLYDAGVKVTINSDDPFFFGNQLNEEYQALYSELDFSKAELVQIARNGFEIALMDDEQKRPFLDQLNSLKNIEA